MRWYNNILPILLICVCASMYIAQVVGLADGAYLTKGCSIQERLLWPLCHANVWHLLANLWAMVTIVKSSFRDDPWTWVVAYVIAISCVGTQSQVCGLSGVIYAELGILSWQALKKRVYHAWCVGSIAVGFLVPHMIANSVHVYCYIVGILIGWAYHNRGKFTLSRDMDIRTI